MTQHTAFVASLIVAWTVIMASAMQLCTVMVVPAIRSDGTAVWQETQDSVFTRMNTFLTANSVSFTSQRKECREIAAAGIQNQTVVSGWIQSQNRFGMCTAFWDGAAATSQQGADAIASDAANQGILLPICDTDPAVIGYLQTIGMVRVCMMDYEALACSWTPSQGIESASFEAAPTYLFSTTPAGVDTVLTAGVSRTTDVRLLGPGTIIICFSIALSLDLLSSSIDAHVL